MIKLTCPELDTNAGTNELKENEMSKESKTTLKGRDARTGEFITVKEARQHPDHAVVERVPKPGHGDTKK